MSSFDFSRMIAFFSSNKIKERNDGLDLLQKIISSRSKLSSKQITQITDAVFLTIDYEKNLYRKNPTNSVDVRISKGAYLLRSLMESCSSNSNIQVKSKNYISVLDKIIELYYIGDSSFLEPAILEFTKTVQCVIGQRLFMDYVSKPGWIKYCNFLMKSIKIILTDSESLATNERVLTELYHSLGDLINSETSISTNFLALYDNKIYLKLIELVKLTSKNHKKENVISISIFKIINKLIIVLSTEDLKACHKLTKLGIRIMLTFYNTKFEKLKDQFLMFLNLSSEFINFSQLPKMAGDDHYMITAQVNTSINSDDSGSEDDFITDEDTEDILLYNLGNLVSRLVDNLSAVENHLSSDGIDFALTSINCDTTWFKLSSILLKSDGSCKPWLLRLGLVKFLDSYFSLKESVDTSVPRIAKRQKLDSASDHLGSSTNIMEFFNNLICSKNHNLQKSGLQLLSFHLESIPIRKVCEEKVYSHAYSSEEPPSNTKTSITPELENFSAGDSSLVNANATHGFPFESSSSLLQTDANHILRSVLNTFDNSSLNYWSILGCNSILVNTQTSNKLKSVYLTRFFKLLLEFIKPKSLCDAACVAIINCLKLPYYNITEKSIHSQTRNLIDLLEINGPGLISNNSFSFFYYIYKLCKELNFTKNLGSRIQDWFITKANLSDSTNESSGTSNIDSTLQISDFISWLCGISIEVRDDFYSHTNDFIDYFSVKKKYGKLECFLLLKDQALQSEETSYRPELVTTNNERDNLLMRLIKHGETYLSSAGKDQVATLNWLLVILKVSENIQGQNDLSHFASSFQYQATRLFDNIKHLSDSNTDVYMGIINSINKTKANSQESLDIIVDNLPVDRIYEELSGNFTSKQVGNSANDNNVTVLDDMGFDIGVSKSIEVSANKSFSLNDISADCVSFLMFLIKFNGFKKGDANMCLSSVLNYLTILDSREFLTCCYYLSDVYLNSIDLKELSPLILGKLIRLLGDKLLRSIEYGRNEHVVITVSSICSLLTPVCINSSNQSLKDDFRDIYLYFQSVSDRKLILTESGVFSFSKFLIRLLIHNDKTILKNNEIMDILLGLFDEASNCTRIDIVEGLVQLISIQPIGKQTAIYNEFFGKFKSPQESVEKTASFCLFFTLISRSSHTILMTSIFNLIEYSKFLHFGPFLERSFSFICKDNHLKDNRSLFKLFRLEILKFWCQYDLDINEFPFTLLNYQDSGEFIRENYKELTSISLSSKSKSNRNLLSYISNVTQSPVEDLIYDSLPLVIGLAFTSDGIRNDIFGKLDQFFKDSETSRRMIKSQLVFILNGLFRFADLSNEISVFHLLSDLQVDNVLDFLIKKDSKTLFSAPNLSVSVSTTVSLLGEIIGRFCSSPAEFWSIPNIHFLIRNQVRLLNEAINNTDRLLALRKIKLFVILASVQFSNIKLINLIFESLCPFLNNSYLHTDICYIILVLFQIGSKSLGSNEILPLLVLIYTQLVNCKYLGIEINGDLKDQLDAFVSKLDKTIPLSVILLASTDIINGFQLTIETSDIETILGQTEVSSSMISLVAFIFHYKPELSKYTSLSCNLTLAKLLLNLKDSCAIHKKFPRSFELWRGRYLGQYYSDSGEIIDTDSRDYRLSFDLGKFSQSILSLDPIFEEMLKYHSSSDAGIISCLESIIGVMIWKYKSNAGDVNKFVNYEKIFGSNFDHILPIDFHLCILMNSANDDGAYILHSDTFAEVVDRLSVDLSGFEFDTWCSRLFLSIVNELARFTTIAPLLSVFVVKVPEFAKHVLSFLISYYIAASGMSISSLMIKMIKNYLEFGNKKSCDKKLFVDLVLLLRVGCKQNVKGFKSIYEEINIPSIYTLASDIGMAKTGLMLMEDRYSEKQFEWLNEKGFLTKIYDQIDDPDLIYGLPVEPTLDYAISMINRNSDNSQNKTMINGGLFDASMQYRQDKSRSSFMIESMLASGSNGISKLINEYYTDHDEPGDSKDQMYNWAWKLSQWDVPIPSNSVSENGTLYKALKLIHDYPKNSLNICEDVLCELVNERFNFLGQKTIGRSLKDQTRSWLRTIAGILNIENVISYKSVNIQDKMDAFDSSTGWYSSSEFSDYENIILARKAAFELLGHLPKESDRLGRDIAWISVVRELCRYGDLARSNNQIQKGVNSAILIDSIFKTKFQGSSPELISYLRRLSVYESAATLWHQGETRIPVVMLKEIHNTDMIKDNSSYMRDIYIPPPLINAYLVKWSSESRQEVSQSIMHKYVLPTGDMSIENPNKQAKVFHMLAQFCDQQLKSGALHTELDRFEKLTISKKTELEQLKEYYGAHKIAAEEKKSIQRFYTKLKTQYATDVVERNSLRDNMNQCVEKAVEFYLLSISISDEFNDEDIDRFCALWLEYSSKDELNIKIATTLLNLSSYKLITWVSQLISRLSDDKTEFQKLLQNLIINLCYKHPYHTLYYLKSLMLHVGIQGNDNSAITSSRQASETIWNELLKKDVSFSSEVLVPLDQFCENSIALAKHKVTARSKKLMLDSLKIGNWWMKELRFINLPPPTMGLPVSVDCDYSKAPRLVGMDPVVSIASSGLSLPKIATFKLSTGVNHTMLLKHGSDDLRQDAIMEQVFEKVNKLFHKNKETRVRNLRVRTYKAVPLGPQSGIIEFVANSIALIDVIRPYHLKYDKIKLEQARDKMKEVQTSDRSMRLKVYEEITNEKIKPILKYWFFENFVNPDEWFKSRIEYSHGIATTSMVGHMLGLGDRHNNNVLLDKSTGEPIHIDLGVAFDQGKLLPIPETVPFRLTRDIVDGFGITDVNGVFKNSCEYTFRVLRNESEHIIGILDVLRWDPLYSWTLSPLKKQKLVSQIEGEGDVDGKPKVKPEEDGSEAGRAVLGVKNKLVAGGLSVEAAVRELISEAIDPQNLSCIYCGWCPFY